MTTTARDPAIRATPRGAHVRALVLLASLAAGLPAAADDGREERAPADLASIDALLRAVGRSFPGRVLKVELEDGRDRSRDGGRRWIYEVKILDDRGHVLEVELDARTLEPLRVKGRRGEREHDGEHDD